MKREIMDNKKSFKEKLSQMSDGVATATKKAGFTKENFDNVVSTISDKAQETGSNVSKISASSLQKVGDTGIATVNKIKDIDLNKYKFDVEDVVKQLMKIPAIRVDRESFLKKELGTMYPESTINKAIENNPAYAGIEREKINKIANEIINFETNKVSLVSFMAGLPGGLAMAATIPTDVLQYFGKVMIVLQKLAYLYGFKDFNLSDSEVNDNTYNELMIFLGTMFGVQGANAGIKIIAESASLKVAKTLANKALTKTAVYPVVAKVVRTVGLRMTKEIFAKSVSKVVPVVGGVLSGGITYATFKPGCLRLQKNLSTLNLSDPNFYKEVLNIDVQ